MTDDYDGPCRICGAMVRTVRTPMDMSLSDAVQQYEDERVCTNPSCRSKTDEMSLSEAV